MKETKKDSHEKEMPKSDANLSEDLDDFIFKDESYRCSEK